MAIRQLINYHRRIGARENGFKPMKLAQAVILNTGERIPESGSVTVEEKVARKFGIVLFFVFDLIL